MLDQSLQFKSGQGKGLPTVFELIHSMRVQVCLPDCEILTQSFQVSDLPRSRWPV